MKSKSRVSLILALITLVILCVVTLSSCGGNLFGILPDFKIKDGVLLKYRGDGEVVEIPEGVTSIDPGAFHHSGERVKEIHFPLSMTELDHTAIGDLSAAVTFHFSDYHPFFYIDNGNIMRQEDKTLVLAARNGEAPSYAAGVEPYAYSSVMKGAKVTLPLGVIEIGPNAFSGCEAGKVVIGPTVLSIKAEAFRGSSITDLEVTVLSPLSQNALSGLTSSKVTVTAPEIKTGAIADSEIETLILSPLMEKIGAGALSNTKVKDLTVPFLGTKEHISSSVYLGIIFGDFEGGRGFEDDGFGNRVPHKLEKVTVHAGTVGPNAFAGAKNVHTIILIDVEGEIGEYAFSKCQKNITLYLGRKITGFESNALYHGSSRTIRLYYGGSEEEWEALSKPAASTSWTSSDYGWNGGSTVNILYESDIPG